MDVKSDIGKSIHLCRKFGDERIICLDNKLSKIDSAKVTEQLRSDEIVNVVGEIYSFDSVFNTLYLYTEKVFRVPSSEIIRHE